MKENAKENELVKKLTNKHYTITTAESCTGGLLSATIINVSGASDVINCAYVTYANEAKENLVSVQGQGENGYSQYDQNPFYYFFGR